MYNFARKNPTARLTSVSSLLLVLGGKTQLFLTPPPPYVSSRHQYRSEFDCLILK